MANKSNKKQADSKAKGGKRKPQSSTGTFDVVSGIGTRDITLFSVGFLIVVFAVLMLVTFISYIFTGAADYDLMEQMADLANEERRYHNVCGSWGATLAYFFLDNLFGLASFLIPPYLIMVGLRMMNIFRITLVRKFILMSLLMVWLSVFLAFVSSMIPMLDNSFLKIGGCHGYNVVKSITDVSGTPGVMAVLAVTAVFYLMYVSVKTIEYVRDLLRMRYLKNLRRTKDDTDPSETPDVDVAEAPVSQPAATSAPLVAETPAQTEDEPLAAPSVADTVETPAEQPDSPTTNPLEFTFTSDDIANVPDTPVAPIDEEVTEVGGEDGDLSLEITQHATEQGDGNIDRGDVNTPYDPKRDLELYKYPPLSLIMSDSKEEQQIDPEEQNANKNRIIQVLRNFGVEISSIKATIGPTITLYEIVPLEGIRITKIRNLEDDIALSLAAEGIRIIAPIPGKGTIGIEVPNKKKCIVPMESVLNSRVYQESTMELPCAVGKTITNEVFMFDLAKAPHLLVAGATGQGKSVGLNAIIASLLYKKHPAELKIVMVDPKKVEFSIYTPIENHFLARLEEEDECIITDVQKVVKTLNSLCQLMDTRYDLLKMAGCRNIKEYNAKFKERKLNPENGHEFMPYIVVVVDEFGDLIMTAGKEVELPICRIAQLARAVGIHMIIATQRPQASIISGAIKTNFPARMAFKVSSMMDSRVVLDRPGAQQLIGRGDMLFLAGDQPVRVQCAFLDTPEVSNICNYISKQQAYLHPLYLPEVVAEGGDAEAGGGGMDPKRLDPLFAEVAQFVVNSQQGSTSMIQRNYSIGYNRAGKIMDQLEKMGVVGPQIGSKPREVLIKDPLTLQGLLNTLG